MDENEPVALAKRDLRRRMLSQRTALAPQAAAQAARAAAARFLQEFPPEPERVVSGYWPIRNELDPLPLLSALVQARCTVVLPVVIEKDRPLVFRRWRPDDTLVDGEFGTRVPAEQAPVLQPDRLLVPLLAFDREGFRLGYGGGFYDRTLAELAAEGHPAVAVGFAYAFQEEHPFLPRDPFDRPLHYVVTEREVVHGRAT